MLLQHGQSGNLSHLYVGAATEVEMKDKKDKYVLDEIPEYVELRDKYAALENDYNEVVAARDALQSANAELIT